MNRPPSHTAIGRYAVSARFPVPRVREVAQELDVAPSMYLNGIEYFDDEGLAMIDRHLRRERDARPNPYGDNQ